jgi:hypothetical protein
MRANILRSRHRFDDALHDLKLGLNIAVGARQARQLNRMAAAAKESESGSNLSGASQQQSFLTQDPEALLDEGEDKDAQQLELEKSLAMTFNGLGVQYFQSVRSDGEEELRR